jgi:hypothetical protein
LGSALTTLACVASQMHSLSPSIEAPQRFMQLRPLRFYKPATFYGLPVMLTASSFFVKCLVRLQTWLSDSDRDHILKKESEFALLSSLCKQYISLKISAMTEVHD